MFSSSSEIKVAKASSVGLFSRTTALLVGGTFSL